KLFKKAFGFGRTRTVSDGLASRWFDHLGRRSRSGYPGYCAGILSGIAPCRTSRVAVQNVSLMAVFVTDTHPLIWYTSGKHARLSQRVVGIFMFSSVYPGNYAPRSPGASWDQR